MSSLHPTLLFFAGALLLWVLPLIGRRAIILLVPATAFFVISQLDPGTYFGYQLFGFDLHLLRVDKLSKVFGYVFTLNAFGCFLFAQHSLPLMPSAVSCSRSTSRTDTSIPRPWPISAPPSVRFSPPT